MALRVYTANTCKQTERNYTETSAVAEKPPNAPAYLESS